MAVQLLENWLLKEQEKIQASYRALNQAPLREPDILFIGDSIIEYYPIYELLDTCKYMVNRGIRGYKTDLLRDHLDAHLFGTAVDKIILLIGTNDIGKEVPQEETLGNLEAIFQAISRDYPLAQIKLLSVLPVSEEEKYESTVYVRTNQKIQSLNQAYHDLCQAYHNVDFVDVFASFLDEHGQLAEKYTTDGLHLTVAGYRVLSKELQKEL
ncbi:N-Acetylneuraminate cytidylyltransferase / Platelet activating factor [Streptococcus sp. DD10]|uniref:SGNH/GDSL hydrolase family protein n=1 Tax=Streptococcus sp. DD10 TaxID=1777878 RepID=UPI000794C4C1|nr:SGNH/GDSL hydrolase family protein [Streptococcus sp. DD10]KXT74631.1 N-Acetylneuraminate cytidylyltransferase / Platelet activating factor [Streptococcus sp. DD10]